MPKTKRQPQKKILKAKPLNYNVGISRWYAKTLKSYVKAMTQLIKPRIPEINYKRLVAILQALEILFCDCYFHNLFALKSLY